MSKLSKIVAAASVATAILAVAAPSQAATNLLVNGDFETAGLLSTDLVGWQLTGVAARTDGPSYVECCNASGGPLGNHFATFSWANMSGYNAISQTFDSVLGQVYNLTFDVGALGAFTNVLVASADGHAGVNYLVQGNNNLNTTFSPQGFSFLGTGGSQTITFAVTSTWDNTDAILDNVNLTAAVPEPASWALMIAGFGMAGGLLRNRRRQALARA